MQKTSYPGILSDEEISASENYFFKKAALEVKECVKKKDKLKSEYFISERWYFVQQRKDTSNRKL